MGRELKAASRTLFDSRNETLNIDELKIGCLQRIADALETLTKSYDSMRKNMEFYRELADDRYKRFNAAMASKSALKGHNTRLRKKLRDIQQNEIKEIISNK